ncbi:glycosyltransferase [Corynebacterium stationis]|uniref:glycosyltransferase n=1 Tax=Corynebacterium stationis TaxID=1705 RepID=UPI00076F9541|nr:glycosyltransferase [Corynebacterium stationis]AMJ45266.1 glycosyl transferase [Corynebacterium stationis]AQX71720.1 glycosyl transferase [Corynebacterium stationis]ASJ19400.1 glycosyl transferase [Corynebacterium stationis]HJG64720.1 glycosyltransferase [Corynebacterium stationis]
MKILLWHVHGSWTDAFVHGPHEYLLPALPEGGPWGLGRADRDWPATVRDVAPHSAELEEVDVVILQRPEDLAAAEQLLGRKPGVDIPAVYVEHNTPRGDVPDSVHPLANQSEIPIVHVTYFNQLFWDNGSAPNTVIEHGIRDPGHLYTGENPHFALVSNEPVRRWRVTGTDLLPGFAKIAPVELFGMGTERIHEATGISSNALHVHGDLKREVLHYEMAKQRIYLHTVRWTSLGLSLLEAMHLGMPVLALATTEATRAIPAETGFLSTHVEDLHQAALRLIDDPELARTMGTNARSFVLERYSLKRFLQDWSTLLSDIV